MAVEKVCEKLERKLKKGDLVMVIAGGHKVKRPIKGQTGKIARFVGKKGDRIIIEGLNLVSKHQKARTPGEVSGIIKKEAPIHISNVMFYAEKAKRPVRIHYKLVDGGKKVRGYLDPKSKEFVQID